MKFKKHTNLMSHLLLAEKHHQLLLRNADSQPVREIHNTMTAPVYYPRNGPGPAAAAAPDAVWRGPGGATGMRGPDVAASQPYVVAAAPDVVWRGPRGATGMRGPAGAVG